MTLTTLVKPLALVAMAGFLSNCASMQSANQVADYNRDGLVSDAEYKQYMKQKNVEDRNVYSESTKRRNAVNTVRDVRDTVGAARSASWMLRNW